MVEKHILGSGPGRLGLRPTCLAAWGSPLVKDPPGPLQVYPSQRIRLRPGWGVQCEVGHGVVHELVEIPGLAAGCVGHFPGVPSDSPGLLVQYPDALSGVLPCPAVSFPGVLPAVATVAEVIEVVLDGHGVEVGEGLVAIPVTGDS